MKDRRTYYELIAITKYGEEKKLWRREFVSTGAELCENIEVGRKKYQAKFDFLIDYEKDGHEDPFSQKGQGLPLIELEDCCSVFVGELSDKMAVVLDIMKLNREDIEVLYYTTEYCRGDVTTYYDEIEFNESNAKELLDKINMKQKENQEA